MIDEKPIDMGLAALIDAGKELGGAVPESLLQASYQIQIKHQYEKDRDIPLRELDQLVDQFVSSGGDGVGQ